MATHVQRWQAICNALLNQPATAAQMLRLGAALALAVPSHNAESYETMTNEQKAEFVLTHLRRYLVGFVKMQDQREAAAIAAAAAENIENEFPVAP